MPVPFDDFAAKLDTGYEGFEGGQSHRAACELLAPPPECLVQFGCVDAMQPHPLPGDDDRVAIDDPGGAGEALGTPAKPRHAKEIDYETSEHSATACWYTYRWWSIWRPGLELRLRARLRNGVRPNAATSPRGSAPGTAVNQQLVSR